MIDLIALDLDGTLLDPRGHVTGATREAIAQARAAGMNVVLSTGRPAPEAAYFAQKAGCDALAVCLGGAALCDAETGEHLRRWDIQENIAAQALALCLGRNIELMIFAGEAIVVDPFSHRSLLRTYPYEAFHRNAVVTEDPIGYLAEHNLPLTKIHGDQNPAAYPKAELAALPGVQLTASNDHDFELVPAGVNKGRALALLALMLGVPMERCAAIGDSDNDLEMLRAVGCPVAMGNACPSVRQAARLITWDNGHDGAAEAIRYLLCHRRDEEVPPIPVL